MLREGFSRSASGTMSHGAPEYEPEEIELSAMSSQCLDRRIDTLEKLQGELGVWQRERNQKTVKWQFTMEDARINFTAHIRSFRLYSLLVTFFAPYSTGVPTPFFLRGITAHREAQGIEAEFLSRRAKIGADSPVFGGA
jgi:hypothetical protein